MLSPTPSAAPPTSSTDPRCVPIKLTAAIPIADDCPYPAYTAEDHAVWRELCTRQQKLLPGRAADEFLSGLLALGLDQTHIPALADVSRRLEATTSWRLARTPGLLAAPDFFAHLARRIFPCTDYIRARAELDYTPAPDCFHDIFGHTPMIMHPRFADFYQKIGQAALNCRDPAVEEQLTRLYWFTVEFGLIKNRAGLRIYGNGIISSFGETQHSLTPAVRQRPFVPEEVAAQPYDIWHFQETLFVIDSFDHLEREFVHWARAHHLL
ncbi:phenylalanine 4-monooxygenase [Horticoccus luteus]|uniref:Phenylalanine 4-monooxygenase n=1 Tax=Horticoccus luteus TaxID=2862869 RepID=A0A8F9XL22_9BACT|nr:phenylalanine 4-monooxygenase [Horticoccus luteus]QYM78776.1 phenylalanine 4-monooxygenase [Horticoccus luteus]